VDRIIPGVMAVVLSDDRRQVLLHRRTDNRLWSVPGGSAEFLEDIKSLVLREVLEETGHSVEIVRAFAIYSDPAQFLFRYADGNNVHSFVLGVECRSNGISSDTLSEDSEKWEWFQIDAIPNEMMAMQLQVIEDALTLKEFAIK
jgi:ADP-ribose pyrophosphatase YjhB (NUDIX family)